MLTQREYDIRQLEAERKIIKLAEEWRNAFLAGRRLPAPEEMNGNSELQPAAPTETAQQDQSVVPAEQFNEQYPV